MLFGSAPSTPEADTAREWAQHELSKGKYQNNNIFGRFLEWLIKQLRGSELEFGDGIPITQILVAVALTLLVTLLVFYLVRVLRSRRRPGSSQNRYPLFGDERTAAELFAAADGADSAKLAVIERYRGIIRILDEHKLLILRPGMTALEASTAASSALGRGELFTSCAEAFNRAYYSELEVTPAQVADTVELARYCQTAAGKLPVINQAGGR